MANLSVIRKSDADNAGIPRVRATVYDSADALPLSGNTQGEQAFVPGDSSTDTLYIWDGGGWYKMALIQTTPTFTSGPESTYTLSSAGSTTVITLVATDAEGIPITYSATTDVGFDSLGTVSQDSSVFTVTPMSEDSANTTSGTITFKASDGISFASSVSTFTLSFKNANSQYTTVLAKASGNNTQNVTFTDGSTNTHSMTTVGDTRSTTFTPHHPGGYSTYFDGTGDYCDVAASGNFSIGTGAFTLECWIKTNTTSADVYYRRVFMLDGPSGNSDNNLQLIISASTGGAQIWTNSGDLSIEGSTNIGDNKWHHIAIVRSGTTITLYVDGRSDGSGTYSSTIGHHNSSQPRPRIGSYDGSNGDFLGLIHELRLVVGTAVYTGIFAPPTSAFTSVTNTKLLIQHVPFMKDNGSSNHAVTVNNTSHKRDGPYEYGKYTPATHGKAVYFDGNGDTIRANADTTLAADNGNFTVELWIYPTALNSYDFMVSMGTVGSYFNYAFFWHNTSHHLFWENGNGGWGAGSAVSSVDDGVVKINQWQHIAASYDGNNFTMWRNGKVALYSSSAGASVGHQGTFAIGARKDAGTYPFTGYMSDVRITQTSVYQYNTAFTPPTEPLTAITGTGLLLQPSQGIYDASGEISRNWKIIGNAGSNTDTLKYASSNMDFDGTGDYITFDVEGGLGDGDFTMEAWIRHDALPSSSHQSYFSSTRGSTGFNVSVDADGDFLWYDQVGGASRKIEAASQISNNTWYHVAFVRQHGIIKGFLSGVQKGSDYSSTTDFSATAFAIGTTVGDLTKSMNGQIEDFRLTKGLSRYPFAPAKETLTTSKSLQNGISCTASNVKLLALTTETVTADASSESHTITNVNSVTGHDFGPVPGMKSALFVEASDQKITMPDGEWKTWGSTFTIECWVYANSWPAAQNYAWGDYNSGGTSSSTSINMKTNSSGQIIIVSYIDTGLATLFTTTTTLALKKWYHVAVVRNSGNFYLFLNGSLLGSNTSYTGTILNSSQVWAIGGTGAYGGYQWDGYISNFRINTAQALYSNTFTPPTSELTG